MIEGQTTAVGRDASRSTAHALPGSVIAFFVLTFAIAWACYIPVAMFFAGDSPLARFLALFGTFAPSMAALLLTAKSEGTPGVRTLLGRVAQSRVAARWYLFAIGYFAAIKLTVAVVHRLATGAWPRFGENLFLIPFALMLSTPVQIGEELGWRGYALPRLARRLGLAPASILLGVIWALWHLPLFYVRWAEYYGQSFPVYAIQVTAISVAIAWLWAQAGGSLLLPMLFHAAVNNTKDIVPALAPAASGPLGLNGSLVSWIGAALLWTCALVFLAWMVRTESRRRDWYGAPPS